MKQKILDAMDAVVALSESGLDLPMSLHEDIDNAIYNAVARWIGWDQKDDIFDLDWCELREFVEGLADDDAD